MIIKETDLAIKIRPISEVDQFLDRWIPSALESIEKYAGVKLDEETIRYHLEINDWYYYAGTNYRDEELVDMEKLFHKLGDIESNLIKTLAPKDNREEITKQTTYMLAEIIGMETAEEITSNKLFMQEIFLHMDGEEATKLNIADALRECLHRRCSIN